MFEINKGKYQNMKNILIIPACLRDKRIDGKVTDWVLEETRSVKGELFTSVADLREINLPSMNEPVPPKTSNEYFYEHTKM